MKQPQEPATQELTSEQGEGSEAVAGPLIPQAHGGALMPPIAKGHTRNPKGRPPDAERLLKSMLRQEPDALKRAAKRLAEVLDDPKSRHWLGALKEVWDRQEGTVAQSTHHHVSTDRAVITHAGPTHAPALPGEATPPEQTPNALGTPSGGGEEGGPSPSPDSQPSSE